MKIQNPVIITNHDLLSQTLTITHHVILLFYVAWNLLQSLTRMHFTSSSFPQDTH